MSGNFDGMWVDQGGFHATIADEGGTMQVRFSDANRGPFPGELAIKVQFSDVNEFTQGTLRNAGQKIEWDNGTVWTRVATGKSQFAGTYLFPGSGVSFQVTDQFTIEGARARLNSLTTAEGATRAQEDPSAVLTETLSAIGIEIDPDDISKITTDDLVSAGPVSAGDALAGSLPPAIITIVVLIVLLITTAQQLDQYLPEEVA